MEKLFSHSIDLELVAKGLGLSVKDTISFLNDGRVMGRLGEFAFAKQTNSSRSKSENTPYDVETKKGEKVEIRSITDQLSFASSKEIGYGRKVTKKGFKEKLNSIDYYAAIDFREIKSISFIKVDKKDILAMEKEGILRKNKSVNAKKFYKKIDK